MKTLANVFLAAGIICAAATAFALTPYSQDFENLVQSDPAALANDGWLVYGNVFGPDWGYWYGYGSFPAPNQGNAFCSIVANEGGAEQGLQQLVIFSDYNNANHGDGAWIEANVFHEQPVGPGHVGQTWTFEFDAKRGNIEGQTTAKAFIKTLDPNQGWATTNFIWIDMTNVPATWGTYSVQITIDPSLENQLLQFGFLSTATLYQGSGIFYDNVEFHEGAVATEAQTWSGVKALFQ
jgi:hypothetical protein